MPHALPVLLCYAILSGHQIARASKTNGPCIGVWFVWCSTNMSIQDADCLGRCLEAQPDNPVAALHKYQQERIPQTTKEV